MIDWEKYGFKEIEPGKYRREDFPFILELSETGDSLLVFFIHEDEEVGCYFQASKYHITPTNQSVVLLLKAFNCPKLP